MCRARPDPRRSPPRRPGMRWPIRWPRRYRSALVRTEERIHPPFWLIHTHPCPHSVPPSLFLRSPASPASAHPPARVASHFLVDRHARRRRRGGSQGREFGLDDNSGQATSIMPRWLWLLDVSPRRMHLWRHHHHHGLLRRYGWCWSQRVLSQFQPPRPSEPRYNLTTARDHTILSLAH